MPQTSCFLMGDLILIRIPNESLVQNPVEYHCPEQLKDSYIVEVQNFFKAYRPSQKDALEVIQKVILDPQVYECLKLLREAIVTRNDLEKLKKKGVADLDQCLRTLFDLKMIHTFQGEQNVEYYCLLSDFVITKIFPRFELDTLRAHYRTKRHNNRVIVQALDILRDEYMAGLKIKTSQKKKSEVKEE
jgi:hypothetical protein